MITRLKETQHLWIEQRGYWSIHNWKMEVSLNRYVNACFLLLFSLTREVILCFLPNCRNLPESLWKAYHCIMHNIDIFSHYGLSENITGVSWSWLLNAELVFNSRIYKCFNWTILLWICRISVSRTKTAIFHTWITNEHRGHVLFSYWLFIRIALLLIIYCWWPCLAL